MKTMKMFVAALVCFASVACVKDNMDPQVSSQPEKGAFVGVRSDFGGTKTKTVLTEDYKVLWDSDDAIAVWDGTEIYRIENDKGRVPSQTLREAGWNVGYRYSVTTKVNSASTGFKYSFYQDKTNHIKDNYTQGSADEEGVLVENFEDISEGYELASGEGTWYLMNSNFSANFIANCETKQFRAWLSNNQKLPVGTFVDSRDFAVAKTQDLSQPVVFKNAVSLLEFVIPTQMDAKITKITVAPNASGEYLAGDLLIDYSGDAPKTSLWALSDDHNALESGKSIYTALTLTPDKGTAFASGKYYAVVCPGTLTEGLTVTATLTTGMTLTRSSENKCTFKESYVYGMGEIDAASENYNGGIKELPYVFSLFATTGKSSVDKAKYVTTNQGTYDAELSYVENYYEDLSGNGVRMTVRGAGKGSASHRVTDYYGSSTGADNIPTAAFVTQESAGDEYVESFYKLELPLAMAMPSSISLTFGMGTNAAAIQDWKIMYSKDGQTWYEGASYSLKDGTTTFRYYIYSVNINLQNVEFGVGDTMYLKWIPTGKNSVTSDSTTEGWNNGLRFWGGVVITSLDKENSSEVSGAVYQESFDSIVGGVDYLMGEKLGYLANCYGEVISNWTANQKGELTGENVAMRTGYVQLGTIQQGKDYNKNTLTISSGRLTTPSLKVTGNLLLTFDAMIYKSYLYGRESTTAYDDTDTTGDGSDYKSIIVSLNEGSFDPEDATVNSKVIENVSSGSWGHIELEIYGATANTQITFASGENANRWFLDDICVTKAQ